MLGAIVIALVITIGLPVSFMMMGAAISFLFGWTHTDSAESDHEGSELIETNY